MLRKLFLLAALTIGSATAVQAKRSPSILDLTYAITDTAVVFPESVQTDVHRMQQNWYLRNYTVLDTTVTAPVQVTDEVLTQRLAALPTTIEMPFNQVVRQHIDSYTNRHRSLVETMLGMSLYYMPIFEEALEREGLPLELRFLPVIESALNPDAVSRAGATGLWQFMLATARGLGMEVNTLVDERRDPLVSSAMAAKYLGQLYEIYHDWSLAIAAYNCGPGNINKALLRAGASEQNPKDYWDIYYFLPAETRGYVPAFIAATYAMTHYADHGISPALARRPILTDTINVNYRVNFDQISNVLNIPVEEIRVLNPQYRKDIIPGDSRTYALRLPSQLTYAYLLAEDSIRAAAPVRRTVVEPRSASDGAGAETVKWHTVRRGETLGSIAAKYGVTVESLKQANGLRSTKVRRGAKLKVVIRAAEPEPTPEVDTVTEVTEVTEQPAEEVVETAVEEAANLEPAASTDGPTVHRVVKGDTPFRIAQTYGITLRQLYDANGLKGKNPKINIGQKLIIPAK